MGIDFSLVDYLNNGVESILKGVMKASFQNPKEATFIMRYILESKKAAKKRKAFEDKGQHIPPFLISSITSNCNLFCKGCYARANNSCSEKSNKKQMSNVKWEDIFKQGKELGISFILLAGGEPLMRKDVIEKASQIKEIIFPIFTNGTMIDEEYIKLFDSNRNLVPVISIEGDENKTDTRRGKGIYELIINKMDSLKSKGILYGVSITVTSENVYTVTRKDFISELYKRGCKVVIFVEYVPVDASTKALAPTDKERSYLENEQAHLRKSYEDMIFISFPGDEKHSGGCLAAGRGFFHINTDGGVEPCPFSPFSDTNLKDSSLLDALQSPLFKKLSATEMLLGEHKGGCVLFEKEEEVKKLLL
ncbi:radical SAM protein [Clostridium amazonitimonense]|uniref:radical SAM protein n=1 Tax=Clostridium amazonitimonense TaxID=1499689 RepID=UPI000509C66F|nr:radical SAM protein [Clostridium amazonitimonense]